MFGGEKTLLGRSSESGDLSVHFAWFSHKRLKCNERFDANSHRHQWTFKAH
jgi:hypothetical protein